MGQTAPAPPGPPGRPGTGTGAPALNTPHAVLTALPPPVKRRHDITRNRAFRGRQTDEE